MTGHTGYTTRQAAYDLRKLRGKELITKPGRARRYHLEPQAAGTIAALLTLREHVIAPILAGVRSPGWDASPALGPGSTATTRRSASTCKPSSTTWASAPPDRQHLVDQDFVSV
jgi:L-2-hydroxyglutarate oxidase LhgO